MGCWHAHWTICGKRAIGSSRSRLTVRARQEAWNLDFGHFQRSRPMEATRAWLVDRRASLSRGRSVMSTVPTRFVSNADLASIKLQPDNFDSDWNYCIGASENNNYLRTVFNKPTSKNKSPCQNIDRGSV